MRHPKKQMEEEEAEPTFPSTAPRRTKGFTDRLRRSRTQISAAAVASLPRTRTVDPVKANLNRGPTEKYKLNGHTVLVGSRLCPTPAGERGTTDGREVKRRTLAGTFTTVSSHSRSARLGPFKVAVACSCKDWKYRSGLLSNVDPLDKRTQYSRDASFGCKHMMAVNTALLDGEPGQLAPNTMANYRDFVEDEAVEFFGEDAAEDTYLRPLRNAEGLPTSRRLQDQRIARESDAAAAAAYAPAPLARSARTRRAPNRFGDDGSGAASAYTGFGL